ncbi:MAG: citrate lyase subunit alpha [Thermoplasmata archaeon]|nr:MAG: citrate lyase subunit alpha [Thermoplasmata archaeon]HHD16375.1 citrate lyase subunit alpha [Euryarchaeota archaeon]
MVKVKDLEWVENAIGRKVPKEINGEELYPYVGPFEHKPTKTHKYGPKLGYVASERSEVLSSIAEAIDRTGLSDGQTISFHHHFRNGDMVMNMVLEEIERKGIRNLTLAPSSTFPCQEEALIRCIRNGTITKVEGGSARGNFGRLVSTGKYLKTPMKIRSHGGRVRAIEAGDIQIDVAFIGAPSADELGNLNGVNGPSACGTINFAYADAIYANNVVAITDNLVPYPNFPMAISQERVDYVVVVDKIGDPGKIASGELRITNSPTRLKIAKDAVRIADLLGYVKEGMSFQAGAGGISLAFTDFLHKKMLEKGVHAQWAQGGTTKFLVEMLKDGTVRKLITGQAFDTTAIESMREDMEIHVDLPIGAYANIHGKGCTVNKLDVVVLGASEVDVDFNCNTVTLSNGLIAEPVGGHSDTAAGAALSIITVPLFRGRYPVIVDRCTTVVTPGETVDVVVTERGIAINPKRKDLLEKLEGQRIPKDLRISTIEELRDMAYDITETKIEPNWGDEIVALIEYRDGTIIDVVRNLEPKYYEDAVFDAKDRIDVERREN